MKIKFFICFLAVFVLSITSCKKDSEVNVFTGYSYYPTNPGHEIIYDVDSIYKDGFTGNTFTVKFQIKEVIESIIADNEGRPTLRLERYKRSTPNDPWVIYKVWTANIDLKSLERKEDNVTYIKLIFPPENGAKWDGNKKNNLDEKFYEITDVNEPDNINGLSFDSTLTVLQNDEDLFISRSLEMERFAAGVGMYYKYQFNGDYKPNSNTEFTNFVEYSETIVSYQN